jgi:hypothetical protein
VIYQSLVDFGLARLHRWELSLARIHYSLRLLAYQEDSNSHVTSPCVLVEQIFRRPAMLSYEDCVALADLTEEEVEAIAQHEHMPEIVAAELGSYLVHDPEGVPKIKRIILDDIEEARRRGDMQKTVRLKLVLKHFVEMHPSK